MEPVSSRGSAALIVSSFMRLRGSTSSAHKVSSVCFLFVGFSLGSIVNVEIGFYTEDNRRETHIRNICPDFIPPPVSLSTYIQKRRRC